MIFEADDIFIHMIFFCGFRNEPGLKSVTVTILFVDFSKISVHTTIYKNIVKILTNYSQNVDRVF